MARYQATCPVCGKQYETTDEEGRQWCSVACQFGRVATEADALRAELAAAREALTVARQMANAVYNANQNPDLWEQAKAALVELLPKFDAALATGRERE